MKIKNILIAGGGGELGVKLIDHLKNKDFKIFVLDKKFNKKIRQNNIKFIKINFLNLKNSKKIPKNIDVVYFLTGITGGPFSLDFKYLTKYLQMNCETLINFLRRIGKKKIKKIIFTSTEQVYNDNFSEKNDFLKKEPHPKNLYGVTKLFAEKILHNYFKKNSISIDILRFPRVIIEKKSNLIVKMKNSALKNNKIYLSNTNLRLNFIYINDLISAFEKCMYQTNTKFRILNIFNNNGPISLKNLAKEIKKKLKIKIQIKLMGDNSMKNHNPQNLRISNKLTKKALDWEPLCNNSQIIKKIINNNEIR
tara:strand:- start:1275 stop:2198 length:924 start_codon:yes stop_codon:yes gene_type:complete